MLYLETKLVGVRMSGSTTLLGSSNEHIEAVTDGFMWWTVAEAISQIAANRRFYVESGDGNRAYVDAVPASLGRRAHLRTRRDGTLNDNLLALPGGPLHMVRLSGLLGY